MNKHTPAIPEIASHRGGAALWPENSERAFRETIALGTEQIEFDVQLSADGVPVIFHDSTLERVTNGFGPVNEHTLAELKRLVIHGDGGGRVLHPIDNDGGAILTLNEGLTILSDASITLRCEIKPGVNYQPHANIVDITLAMIESHALMERTIFTSFYLPHIRELVLKAGQARDVLWLVSEQMACLLDDDALVSVARDVGVQSLALHHALLEDSRLHRLRAAGLVPSAFAVYEDAAIETAIQQGLPVFTTDRPDAALRIRKSLSGM